MPSATGRLVTPQECDALVAILSYLEDDQNRNPEHWADDGYETYSAIRKLKELLPLLKAWSGRSEHEKADALEEIPNETLREILRRLS
jgi:hypothetical protein